MPDAPRRRLPLPSPGWLVVVLFLVGLLMSTLIPGNLYRGWFALTAFLFSLTFVLVYRRRNWRSTFAGRASMLSMTATVIYTANVVLVLWWPYSDEYGYPHWEDATEVIYLMIALAALYKLLALIRAGRQTDTAPDPTVEVHD